MTLTKRGKFWHYRFRHRGQEFSGSTKLSNHRDAAAWEAQYKARLAMGEVGLCPPPTMRQAWASWLEQAKGRVSKANIDRATCAWKYHLEPILGNLRADQVTEEIVALVRSRYLEGRTKRTYGATERTGQGANTVLAYLKAIMRPLVRQGFLRRLPAIPMPRPQAKARAWVSEAQLRVFLDAVDRTGNLHQSVACRAMLFLGLREGEALGMKWQWFSDGLKVYTPGRTKGREAVPLPVRPELRVFLHSLTWGVPQVLGWVLPAEDGRPHRGQFTRKAIERSGIAGLTPHSLRRTCATQMHRAGVPLATIQAMLRHKSIETTMRYVQVGLGDLCGAVERTWGAQNSHTGPAESA